MKRTGEIRYTCAMNMISGDKGRERLGFRGPLRGLKPGRQDLNLRSLGPARPTVDCHTVAGRGTGSPPVDLLGVGSAAGSHTEPPIAPGTTPFGAPVARLRRGVEDWIGPTEVAARLKVNRATVYALVKSGQLRHRRVGLQIRVPLSALEEFLAGSQ